jgi:hypothetical protein
MEQMVLTKQSSFGDLCYRFAERVILHIYTEGQIMEEKGEKLLALENERNKQVRKQ